MHVDKVSAEPLTCGGAVCATSDENCGESAATAMPHSKYKINVIGNGNRYSAGEMAQKMPDTTRQAVATSALP